MTPDNCTLRTANTGEKIQIPVDAHALLTSVQGMFTELEKTHNNSTIGGRVREIVGKIKTHHPEFGIIADSLLHALRVAEVGCFEDSIG